MAGNLKTVQAAKEAADEVAALGSVYTCDTHYNRLSVCLSTHFGKKTKKHLRDTFSGKLYTESYADSYAKSHV
jgi:hypothetical protein